MRQTLLKYLEKTGKLSEFNLFLNLFQNVPKANFAIIKISGETLEYQLETIADDIAFLARLSLFPIIIHGAGSKLNSVLENSKKIDGIRVSPKSDIPLIKKTFDTIAKQISTKIESFGGRARVVEQAVFCEYLNQSVYGNVGRIVGIDVAKIDSTIADGYVPIISPIGISKKQNEVFNINADSLTSQLTSSLGIKRLIFITQTGGILNSEGSIIPFVNIADRAPMRFVTHGMRLKLNEIKRYLRKNPQVQIAITSAHNLLSELFSIGGSGTSIKNHIIKKSRSILQVDKETITNVLNDSFGKTLIGDYFEEPINSIFYQKDYEAVAILKQIDNLPYLCKFAVSKAKQGTGLGKALWSTIVKDSKSLVWRSDAKNSINPFYYARSDGMIKSGKWHIFWKAVPKRKIWKIAQIIAEKPESFTKPL